MIREKRNFLWLVVLILCVSNIPAQAEQWPQFRGIHSDGVAGSEFPQTWDESKNVHWKFKLNGEGWSCPVVWDDKIFLTSAVRTDKPNEKKTATANRDNNRRRNRTNQGNRRNRGNRGNRRSRGRNSELMKADYSWQIICLNANSGKKLWSQDVRKGHPAIPRHSSNSYATETPITDGQRVYAYFGMTGLFCYDMDGNFQWKKDLGKFSMKADWGTSSSPALFDGKLFVQIDNEDQSFLVALDSKSGNEIWKVKRDEPSQYSTPIIWQNSQRKELITVGAFCRSYNPADGQLLWELDMGKGRSSASALAVGDHLYVGTEFRNKGRADDGGGFLFSVAPGGSGNITPEADAKSNEFIDWKISNSGLQMASPVLCEGHLYLFERRRGLLHCINAETGETAYRKRISGARAFWASPWTDGKHVYCLDDSGTTYCIASGPDFRLLGKNMIEEQSWSSPAIANGALYLRTIENLYCITTKKEKES